MYKSYLRQEAKGMALCLDEGGGHVLCCTACAMYFQAVFGLQQAVGTGGMVDLCLSMQGCPWSVGRCEIQVFLFALTCLLNLVSLQGGGHNVQSLLRID